MFILGSSMASRSIITDLHLLERYIANGQEKLPELVNVVPIAFKAYVRSKGKVIAGTDQIFDELDLNLLLPKTKSGDHLIVEPVNDKDWWSKRVLKLIL